MLNIDTTQLDFEEQDPAALEQGTQTWLEFRRRHVGSSDAPVIMGVSPYSTPYQLWARKLGLMEEQEINSAMQRGKDLESVALAKFEDEMGLFMAPMVVVSEEHPWMMASLDGLSFDRKIAVEIKCPNRETHQMALNGQVPDKYIYQLQHQMLVLNLDFMYYFSFDGQNGVTLRVEKDPTLCNSLFSMEQKFWLSILNKEPPELCERDYIQKTDENWLTLANRWKQIRDRTKELEQEEERVKSALIYLADQQNAQGGGIRVQTVSRKGVVDYSKVPELKGVDLEQYRKPITQTFRITEVK